MVKFSDLFKLRADRHPPHAMSQYTAVTAGLIEQCQRDYRAGQEMSRSAPGLSALQATLIAVESIEADQLLYAPLDQLMRGSLDGLSDWSLAVAAEMLFELVKTGRNDKSKSGKEVQEQLENRAWQILEQALDSPTVSPMLAYEEIFFFVAQEYWMQGDPHALLLLKRGLVHNLHYDEGSNVASMLRDLAEAYLWVGDARQALRLYTALLRNDPADIWVYNSIALIADRFGLAPLGHAAARRGLVLLEQKGDEERLHDQISRTLTDQPTRRGADLSNQLDPIILAEFETALQTDFDAGHQRPYPALAYELLPDLNQMPVKAPSTLLKQMPARTIKGHSSTPSVTPGRNDPCWCGSGKKYKHCHMATDKQG